MYIHGSFMTETGSAVTVEIVTRRDRTREIRIGEEGSGVAFTSRPVEITSEVNDTFDHIWASSATVRLESREMLGELFCPSCMDAVVNIRRDGELLFAGYVEPQTYTQGFNELYDEIEVNCIDALSALQYRKYGGVGSLGVSYDAVRAAAGQVTFLGILRECLRVAGTGLDLSGGDVTARYDGSVRLLAGGDPLGVFSGVEVSELLFLGSGEDDVWSMRDVLEEAMRYLCLHIRQEGARFDIFSRDTLKSCSPVEWHALHGEAHTVGEPRRAVAISAANCGGDDTTLSIGEVFNRVTVACSVKEAGSLVESPLDSATLRSPYTNRQKYMTEYITEGDGKTSAQAFLDITNGRDSGYTEARVNDWFIQVRDSLPWRFQTLGGTDLMELYCGDSNRWQHRLAHGLTALPGAALLSFGKVGRDMSGADNSPVSKIDMTTSLVVSVNGNGKDTPGEAYPNAESLLSASPCAVYTGNVSGGVLSPADDDTTNYIVISGRVALSPLNDVTCLYADRPRDSQDIRDLRAVGSRNNPDGRFYTQQWWESETPVSPPSEAMGQGLVPFISDGPEQYEFRFSAIGDGTDRVSKVAVLACMLVIGDKCVVETGTSGGVGDFEWRDYKERADCRDDDEYYAQSFTIGFDPKIGDRLVGNEFPVQNNIDYTLGLEEEGTAIPVRRSDRVSGRVRFMVLGPVNTLWGEVTRRHPTWFRSTKWTESQVPLMAHVSAIFINDFEVRVFSDNGLVNNAEGSDLVYMSDTREDFLNPRDDVDFRFTTALTSEERRELGQPAAVALSSPLDSASGTALLTVANAVTGDEGKPEGLYVDSYYREYSAPRVRLSQKMADRPECVQPYGHYTHPALSGKRFFVTGVSRDLREGWARLELKECD